MSAIDSSDAELRRLIARLELPDESAARPCTCAAIEPTQCAVCLAAAEIKVWWTRRYALEARR